MSANFSLYPNPTSSQLFIESDITIDKIEILDISGRAVKTIVKPSYSIDVSDIPKGIYFLRLTTKDRVHTQKFIKE
jgi:hypothetical protein